MVPGGSKGTCPVSGGQEVSRVHFIRGCAFIQGNQGQQPSFRGPITGDSVLCTGEAQVPGGQKGTCPVSGGKGVSRVQHFANQKS